MKIITLSDQDFANDNDMNAIKNKLPNNRLRQQKYQPDAKYLIIGTLIDLWPSNLTTLSS